MKESAIVSVPSLGTYDLDVQHNLKLAKSFPTFYLFHCSPCLNPPYIPLPFLGHSRPSHHHLLDLTFRLSPSSPQPNRLTKRNLRRLPCSLPITQILSKSPAANPQQHLESLLSFVFTPFPPSLLLLSLDVTSGRRRHMSRSYSRFAQLQIHTSHKDKNRTIHFRPARFIHTHFQFTRTLHAHTHRQ